MYVQYQSSEYVNIRVKKQQVSVSANSAQSFTCPPKWAGCDEIRGKSKEIGLATHSNVVSLRQQKDVVHNTQQRWCDLAMICSSYKIMTHHWNDSLCNVRWVSWSPNLVPMTLIFLGSVQLAHWIWRQTTIACLLSGGTGVHLQPTARDWDDLDLTSSHLS